MLKTLCRHLAAKHFTASGYIHTFSITNVHQISLKPDINWKIRTKHHYSILYLDFF